MSQPELYAKMVASVGLCAAAAAAFWKGMPSAGFLTAFLGLAVIWDR